LLLLLFLLLLSFLLLPFGCHPSLKAEDLLVLLPLPLSFVFAFFVTVPKGMRGTGKVWIQT